MNEANTKNILRIYVILLAQIVFTLALTITGDSKAAITLAWLYTIAGACVNFAAHYWSNKSESEAK